MKLICIVALIVFLVIFPTVVSALPANSSQANHPGNILILPMNGTQGATTFSDCADIPHVITVNGAAKIDTTISRFGGSSGVFGGADGTNIVVPNGVDIYQGQNNFTFGFWLYRNGTQDNVDRVIEHGITIGFSVYFSADQKLNTAHGAVYPAITSTDAIPDQTWIYVSVVRDGDTRMYIDGVQSGSTYAPSWNWANPSENMYIGSYSTGTYAIAGNIDDLTLLRNVSVPGNIVPSREFLSNPTAAFSQNVTVATGSTPVQFTNTSLGNAPTSAKWLFTNVTGNNTEIQFSTEISPTQIFGYGNYTINQTVSNQFGNSSSYSWLNISEGGSGAVIPIVQWFVNSQTLTFPRYLIGNDSSLNTPTAWCWTFGDGSAQVMTNNITYQYVKRGVWNASLNASNAAGYNQSYKLIRILGFSQGVAPGMPGSTVPWQEQASMEYGTYSVSRELSPAEKAMTDCKLIGLCG